jgi:hypothetical protein
LHVTYARSEEFDVRQPLGADDVHSCLRTIYVYREVMPSKPVIALVGRCMQPIPCPKPMCRMVYPSIKLLR